MSDNNCTNVDAMVKRYFLPAGYGIIFCLGLVGNIISIGIYVAKLRPWKSNHILMVCMALTDLFFVLTMPFFVYYYTNRDDWTFGDFMCRFVRFVFHFSLYGSILFLTCLAVFRYVVVMWPLRAARLQEKRWGLLASALVWALTSAEVIPMITMITLVQKANHTYCLDFASNDPATIWWYGWLLTVFGFLLPLLVVCVCYISITGELKRGISTNSTEVWMRVRGLTVLILVVFVSCFLPYHLLRILRVNSRRKPEVPCLEQEYIHAAYIITRPLVSLNSVFNLALYTLAGRDFKQAFLSTFKFDKLLAKTHFGLTSNRQTNTSLPNTVTT
ncbi:2-oxoglutarate receptor 1-like [Aplochiton taeniatus]